MMTRWTLLRRNLRFHARAHLGVLLGAVIGSAALVGALVVGDSVRASLRAAALGRLGPVEFALHSPDRLFQSDLRERLASAPAEPQAQPLAAALVLPGVVARQDGSARANRVQVLGVEAPVWAQMAGWSGDVLDGGGERAALNETLARQLGVGVGDDLVLRVRKPTALGLDAALSPRDADTVALRLKVGTILSGANLGDFSLSTQPAPPANLFLPLNVLAERTGHAGRANLLAFGAAAGAPAEAALTGAQAALQRHWQLEDAGLSVRLIAPTTATNGAAPPMVEVSSSRIFLEPPVVEAAEQQGAGIRVLTYLANLLRAGAHATPYSMVCAADPPYVPAELGADEILVNEWLANDLQVKPGDRVELSYYVADSGSQLLERTNAFRVRAIVPLQGLHADRALMPEFPGVAKAESTHDWDTGFPLVHKIRDQDEAYWKQYRGTPKAFISLAAGQAMWANRFGTLTAIRFQSPAGTDGPERQRAVAAGLRAGLAPAELGLQLEPVRARALRGAAEAQDFGQLFLGFSFFLVLAALLLMSLLFQFSLEQRSVELGTLLALGFSPKQVRRWLLVEGMVLGGLGGVLGAVGGLGYARAMLLGLGTLWRDAVGESTLRFHVTLPTLLLGGLAGMLVAVATIGLTSRRQARQPARCLLAGEVQEPPRRKRRRGAVWASVCWLAAAGLLGWTVAGGDARNAGVFFGAGSLLLAGGLAALSAWLDRLATRADSSRLSLVSLGVRGCARRRKRSLATIALLACGSFIIVAIGAFRLDAELGAAQRTSGTGGFALLGESALPVVQDLNGAAGREFFGLNAADVEGVHVVPFRVRAGDDASCLSLNRAQRPRLLGVQPEQLAGRFTFAAVVKGLERRRGWEGLRALETQPEAGVIPAIGDANSIQWALGKKLGDTLDYTDEQGRPFKLRLVGAVANSLLQGCLLIDEAQFVKRFPNESGYRMFLMDVPPTRVQAVSATLSRALQDAGLEVVPCARRLNQFNAVQNTYLGTFQVLGGLGLLLGSAGLGVVVLRNVLERRGELALLTAVGFRRAAVQKLVLSEHGALLGLGLGLGLLAAVVAILPALLTPATGVPWRSLLLTLAAVLLNAALWTWLATRAALRGQLLAALRNE